MGWMTPEAVARAVGGRVIRTGHAASGVSVDSRKSCEGALFVALAGPNHDGHDHVAEAVAKGARGLLVSRPLGGLPRERPGGNGPAPFVVSVEDTGAALVGLAAEHRQRHRARVVGITGSCGKTTTKDWLGAVLSAAMPTVKSPASFNNRVGVPLTLFKIESQTRAAVVEIGTSAPGEIERLTRAARPDVAVVTCVAPAHLSGLGSLEGVAREKASLPFGVARNGLFVLNADDASCRAMAAGVEAEVQTVALDRDADWFATDVRFHALGTSFRLRGTTPVTLPRLGTHNVYNALFVIAVAAWFGVPEDVVLAELARVPAASRRLEPKVSAGVTVFDDTYNMNPRSAQAGLLALAGMPGTGRRIAVFGEMLELGERSAELHRDLGAAARDLGMDVLICVGEGSWPIADGALAAGMPAARIHRCRDGASALDLLSSIARTGDRILCKASRRVELDRVVDAFLAVRGRSSRELLAGGS